MRIGLVVTLALVLCACGSKDEQSAANKQDAREGRGGAG